ncbi:hypothetical protein, partial [Rhizobium halophilum]|uniref:hypothetical protein n=1 Tax=Rhizobium halophilum TaxID=2846852 RepID=UPI001EFE4B73
MTKTLNIALLAATLIAGAAHAEGDYYRGASKNAPVRSSQVDTISTGSISVATAAMSSASTASADPSKWFHQEKGDNQG